MSKKNVVLSEEQQQTIVRAGLNPSYWTVIKDLRYSMIICNRETKEVRMIGK